MLTDEAIAKMKQITLASTGGVWVGGPVPHRLGMSRAEGLVVRSGQDTICGIVSHVNLPYEQKTANLAFLASSRSFVTQLLAEVDELRKARSERGDLLSALAEAHAYLNRQCGCGVHVACHKCRAAKAAGDALRAAP